MDRRKVLSTSGAAAVAALAGCATGGAGSSSAAVAHRLQRRPADAADRRHERDVPGAADLLHRPQLRRACARDGVGSEPRAAVLLPEAQRRDPVRRHRHDRRPSVSAADQELPLRDRARRRARQGRPQRSGRAGAHARLRLHGRPRHDPARPAAGDGRREEAVGDRQELRPLGADGAAAPRRRRRPLHQGRDQRSRSTASSSRTPT